MEPGGTLKKRTVFAGLLLMAATFLGTALVRDAQEAHVRAVTDTFSRVFTAKFEEKLRTRLDIAGIVQSSWRQEQIGNLADFIAAAQAVHNRFDDLQALNWIDANGVIRAVIPTKGNRSALGLDVTELKRAGPVLDRARRTGTLQVTPPITLAQGGEGFVAYHPVRRDGETVGFLNLVFRSAPLVESTMTVNDARSFRVTIRDGETVLYERPWDAGTERFMIERQIEIAGRRWTVATAPSALELAQAQSYLDEIVLLGGSALSFALLLLLNHSALQRETLAESEERFALALKGANDGVFDIDLIRDKAHFSPRWFEMLGYEPGELPMTQETFLSLLHPEDAARDDIAPIGTVPDDAGMIEREFRMAHKDGSWVRILSRASVIRRHGRLHRIVGTHVDITELRRQQDELARVAATDDLTGLRNRRGLNEILDRRLSRLGADARLAVMHIDLDMFKSVNDIYGHEAGDRVLRITARRLRAHALDFDTLVRFGGDEFLLFAETCGCHESLAAKASEIIEDLAKPIELDNACCKIGASVGIACLAPDSRETMAQAIVNADIALSAAKAQGRGRFVFFQPEMRAAAIHAGEVTVQIREGLERDEFRPFFQPQVDLATGRITGFEALARWNHPTRGMIGAAEFIPHAEKSLLVEAIDARMFHQACDALRHLAAADMPEATISVNLSTAQMSDPGLVQRLVDGADTAGVARKRLCIEILESTLLGERTANVIENIHDLAQSGFKLELDDFGTGHTAIASLRNFPVSRIKIDRSLVSGVERDGSLQAITRAIIELGRKLGISILAEGVETQAEHDFFAAMRCDAAQGYYVAPPMPLEELLPWIRRWNDGQRSARRRVS